MPGYHVLSPNCPLDPAVKRSDHFMSYIHSKSYLAFHQVIYSSRRHLPRGPPWPDDLKSRNQEPEEESRMLLNMPLSFILGKDIAFLF